MLLLVSTPLIHPLPLFIVDAAAIGAAVEVIANRGFAYLNKDDRFRVDLVKRNGIRPTGLMGTLFRVTAEDPKTEQTVRMMFALDGWLTNATRQTPWALRPELVEIIN